MFFFIQPKHLQSYTHTHFTTRVFCVIPVLWERTNNNNLIEDNNSNECFRTILTHISNEDSESQPGKLWNRKRRKQPNSTYLKERSKYRRKKHNNTPLPLVRYYPSFRDLKRPFQHVSPPIGSRPTNDAAQKGSSGFRQNTPTVTYWWAGLSPASLFKVS